MQYDGPNSDEARQFWSKIWSEEGTFNRNAAWLRDIEDDFSRVKQQENVQITTGDVLKGIRKMSTWKAPGPDGVQGFWFKKFTSVHQRIVEALSQCLNEGCVPDWMVKGRTVLIQKNPDKGTSAENFRPITCLPLMWKLLTGIFSESIYNHLEANCLLKDEQKGCRKKSRGTKDQLLVDKAVMRWANLKHRCLSMAWVDYKKAFDMVPHDWICKVLSLSKIAGNIERLIKSSMSSWQTNLTCNGEDLGPVNINRGIFQGDSLSPLIFVMIMVPLTLLLRKEKMGIYYSEINEFINHLLFMDDLKLYAQSERTLAELVGVVEKFSRDIGMKFGIEKCACITIKNGNVSKALGIELPSGESIKTLDNEGYKYLGVLQYCDIKHKEMKLLVKNEYLRRVKAVAKSKLLAKNLFMSINSWAVSVVRYSAGIVDWGEKELKDIDIKTRKILTMSGVFHRKGNVDRLYIKRENGGRGLISIEDCVKMEENNLRKYMFQEPDRFLQAANFVISEDPHKDTALTSKEFKERVRLERDNRVINKKMHGKYFKEIQEIGCKKRYDWLTAGRITKSFEGLIFAAQEQVLPTNWLRARITGKRDDAYCRKCKTEIETVAHLVSGCSALCQSEYLTRHNKMGLRVYWEICRKYGIKCGERWYEETPDRVRQSQCGNYEVWWDRAVETAKKVDHNKPDIVFINKKEKKWTIADFSVPHDRNIIKKEEEKISNYSPLAYEIRKLHSVSTTILPLVVGALGNVTENLEANLGKLGIPNILKSLQLSAVIGTAIILRKVLSLD
ncbi:MAG: reverse transcriptase family protein [Cyanobacteria bacterium J06649_11]